MNSNSRYFWYFLPLVALAVAFLGQVRYDTWARNSPRRLPVSYNEYIEPQPLSGEQAKFASFGAREFLADWYWISAILYYGGGDPYGQYRKLPELFDTITDLAPKFEAAYDTGMIILPGEGHVDQALALGQKSQDNLPDRWEGPYYTGIVNHIYKKDYLAAAKQFELAASKPNAPERTKYFAGIYYGQAEKRETAYAIFLNIYENSTDDFFKERAKKYLDHFQLIFALEDAAKKYQEKTGHFPDTLNDLVTAKIINGVPESPLNRQLTIDPQTGEVKEVAK